MVEFRTRKITMGKEENVLMTEGTVYKEHRMILNMFVYMCVCM